MILNNFFYHVGQYLRENRRLIIKTLFITLAVFVIGAFLVAGVAEWQHRRHLKRVEVLEREIRTADEKAKAIEVQAQALKTAIDAKYAQIRAIEERASTAERNLQNARRAVVP